MAFNIGVELGQILVLILVIPVLNILFRNFVKERIGTILLSALLAHSAWHWMAGRWTAFRAYEVAMTVPAFDTTFLLAAMRIGLVVAISAAAALAVRELASRLLRP